MEQHRTDARRTTIVVAPDSFKGSGTAAEVASAMAAGFRDVLGPDARIVECPMADGGEGTLDALAASLDARISEIDTVDAIGRPRTARIAVSADGRTGVIEAAEANGLPHVSDAPLQPLRADSHGVGVLARQLLDDGVFEILLCIGGSASNDGGTGFLSALGARFLDGAGSVVEPGAAGLANIDSIDVSGLHPRAGEVTVRIAVDVDNPLLGDSGAAAVFGPQKGATPSDVETIDSGLAHLADVLKSATGTDVTTTEGMGAAGGLPAALAAYLDVQLMPGSDMVMTAIGFEELCSDASMIVTGEGSFDSQSLRGKVVAGVRRAAPPSCPVVVIAGRVVLTPEEIRGAGVTAAFSIAAGPSTLEDMSSRTTELAHDTAAHVAGLYKSLAPHAAV